MLLNSDYYTPAEMTGYVREGMLNYPANQFMLARWLPNKNVDDLVYRVEKGGETLIDAASYRSYDAESSIGSRPGITRVSGELPPISRKVRLGEYDRLRQRANAQGPIQNALLGDGERMARQVNARIELARGDALVNGSVTIAELTAPNQTTVVKADFGRSGSQSVVPAGALWSVSGSAKPIGDLETWVQAYIDLNGVAPGAILTSKRVRRSMLDATSVQTLNAVGGVVPSLVDAAGLSAILEKNDLPPIFLYEARVKVNGVSTRIIPDNVVILLPEPTAPDNPEGTDLGATFWGQTAESLDPKYGLEAGAEAGIVAGVYDDQDPIALWTKAAAISLPVLANPDLTMVGTVL